jgi:serine/threonine protein phosphatase PrpC
VLRVAEVFKDTDTGRARRANEDALFARSPLFAVADGMGGAQAGEVASNIAVEVLQGGLPDGPGSVEERLAGLVQEANARIHELSRADEDRAGMGTTMTAAYVGETDLTVAHVGDSRLYCMRDGQFTRRTDDHSLVEELVREGRLTPQEADEHPQRSIITRALGPEGEVVVDHHTWSARAGDIYLLCSDGLTSMVPEARIAEILRQSRSLAEAGSALIDAANRAGGRDNITVVLFRLEEVAAPSAGAADDTGAGDTAVHTQDVKTAVRDAEARVVPRRLPVMPSVPQAAPRRRRGRAALRVLVVLAVIGIPVLLGGYFASQSVYFVGVGGDGFVTLYRGLPYELPAGVNLYTKNYVSGVASATLPPRVQKTVTDHTLRSHDDAVDLMRQLELGKLAGQR